MFPEDKVKLRWSDHSSFFAGGLASFLQEEAFHDVCIACRDGSTLGANRLVLSVCSHFFRQTLTLCRERSPTILLPDMYTEDMMALLEFMYRGEVYVTEDRVPHLLMMAKKLQINGLGGESAPPPPPPPPETNIPVESEVTPLLPLANSFPDGERYSLSPALTHIQPCLTPSLTSPQQQSSTSPSPTQVATRSSTRSAKSSSGQDKVECETCHRLIYSTSMYQHKRYHHGPLREPASCCGQAFLTRWDLSVHRKTSPQHSDVSTEGEGRPQTLANSPGGYMATNEFENEVEFVC
ncbi:protein tramtrack, beta isoform-like [Penaeus japonicus]|uniref:protein tramtrack, beta isoform-like n=1 Tax=Penaeus japonicus TaxID=27405 RepID=UPI001C712D70|nr:protein tramtrack, beta isoform-like [Penaeus japonicus]